SILCSSIFHCRIRARSQSQPAATRTWFTLSSNCCSARQKTQVQPYPAQQEVAVIPKLTTERLGRRAIVYVRQSSPGQVLHNQESQKRQYGLVDRARELGFKDIVVIDDDLGRSGSGLVERPGFQRL